jgi:Phage tail assembly chaperone protein
MDVNQLESLGIVALRFRSNGNVMPNYIFTRWVITLGIAIPFDITQALETLQVDPVYNSDPPTVGINQIVEWDGAIQVNGRWVRNWKIVEDPNRQNVLSAGKLAELRRERNALLVASDWTQSNDSPLNSAKRAEWATYRQKLRDITKQDISAIVWPVPPSA